jgi:hypothetical protein
MQRNNDLTEEQWEEIIRLRKSGVGLYALERQFKVGYKRILKECQSRKDYSTRASGIKKYIISSVLNDCPLHPFYKAVKSYCYINGYELLCIPVAYKNISLFSSKKYEPSWDSRLASNYIHNAVKLDCSLIVEGSMNIQATATSPLSGLHGYGKGNSVIFGHPKIELKTLPSLPGTISHIQMTTGTLSKPSYSKTKDGKKAEFHHSIGAVIVETDGVDFWFRYILGEKGGAFIDLDTRYLPDGSTQAAKPALCVVGGDVHVGHHDEKVCDAIFKDLVNTVKPKTVVLHDFFDAHSISHHHKDNPVLRAMKRKQNTDCLEGELNLCLNWLRKYDFKDVSIIRSNHHDHLDRWLDNPVAGVQSNNLFWWYYLQAMRIKIGINENKIVKALPLALRYLANQQDYDVSFLKFPSDLDPLKTGAFRHVHGDEGVNGSRGGATVLSKVEDRLIAGHGHSFIINGGYTQVGHTSHDPAIYTKGYNCSRHGGAVVYANGQETLIPVIKGKFRL